MVDSTQNPPILILHELDQRSRQHAHALPQQIEVKTTRDGIGLRLGEVTLVVPMEQVKEILTSVTVSRIPGAREWVRGVANVRGNLLPILDLNGFIFGETSRITRHSRVLVMQHKGVAAGLMVSEVLGMRHFLEDEFSNDISQMNTTLQPLLNGVFRQSGEAWGVFDIHKLVDLPEFMQVAA
ncbi:MAG: chemotaxis protein CheW [Gammaproteobacteria bacterium]|nr:chemotaxis protein CheW [Gammaproteobacteria bacterium]MCW8928220.1 chemotaxis protein CheW [Gammaproteobacteria bacterium]MCW8957462.1 chemotaxis protein CheW [Gammaproteobacteria bacterium]MCW8973301.1 chemotaxis protein CheW [Gammaproteobacteria bacterium]MCW8992499.1 chemotaxis protein CheW [Gammaproteobacteria bacterium]